MALREIVKFPDARLKKVADPIEEITDAHRELAADMCEVMYDEPGIGLAAPQVGEGVRLIVVDTEWTEEPDEETGEEPVRNPLVVVNPEILEPEGKLVWNEGCLSVPDFTADVERAERILLRGLDLDGKAIEEWAEGLRAVCFQHEVDHLNGVLFIDRISRLKRSMYVKKRKKQLLADEEEDDDDTSGTVL
jgi:peptide deformylase